MLLVKLRCPAQAAMARVFFCPTSVASVRMDVLSVAGVIVSKSWSTREGLLVLLCYKRNAPQIGQQGSWDDKCRESLMRSVAIEFGLCRSARTRPAGPKVGRKRGRA